ncbi:MAG: tyrosine-type recombinase/integrase [Bacteroidota bacterium]
MSSESLAKSRSKNPSKARALRASQVLKDYEYWLIHNYKKAGTYLVNAKTFLKTYKAGGTVISQLDSYSAKKGPTLQSFLRRFKKFLEVKNIMFIVNDLNEKRIPKGNIYVKLFLVYHQDRLRGELSSGIYATVLNQYFNSINHNLKEFNKKTAEKFILSPALSDYTSRLYKSVLRAFCQWALLYQGVPDKDLNRDEKKIKKGLKLISGHSLREIASIKVKVSRDQLRSYHKGSLSKTQRIKLLGKCKSPLERAVISLMAWNGLRTIEIVRLGVGDCQFRTNRLAVWSKGKSAKSRDIIKLFSVPRRELQRYIKSNGVKKGRLFPRLTKKNIDAMVRSKFTKLQLRRRDEKFSPHSLRHTAGQLMYDKGIRLEFIQKTLRHSVLETTLVYAQRAIDRNYFKMMPNSI